MLDQDLHFDVPADVYHADPAPEPSLSSSLACTLLDKSPRHAWIAHPRLNPDFDASADEPTRPKEIGSAAHKLVLGRGAEVAVVPAADYRSQAAKGARAAAYSAGLIPILEPDMRLVQAMAQAAAEQIAETGLADAFHGARSEVVAVWRDPAGPWCRAMFDKVLIGQRSATIFDLKCSATSISPAGTELGRKIVDMDYELRAAFYERGLAQIMPDLAGRIRFVHIWLEMDPPHGLVATVLDGTAMEIGRRKAAAAIGMWQVCKSRGTAIEHWPRYPGGVHRAEYPAFAESAWLEREATDVAVAAALIADPVLSAVPPDRPAQNILRAG